VMGERTRAALREFQRARGLDPTGEPNERTLAELGVE
jgi:peptidoglycan hydrolase-like protein with peptidoglycan-binding domain